MIENKTSSKRGRTNLGIGIGSSMSYTGTSAVGWKDTLKSLFQSHQERKDGKIAEKRAVEIQEIINVLETMPFSECDPEKIEPVYLYYNAKNPVIEEGACLYDAANNLVKALKQPLVFLNGDDTHSLNEILLYLAEGFSESIRRSDADGAYFCLGSLRNLIYEMRPRIVTIKDKAVRGKYIEDVIEYGKLAYITSGFYQKLLDINKNLERLTEISDGYMSQRENLEEEYSKYIYSHGGERLHQKLRENQKTIGQLRAEGKEDLAEVLELSEEYTFLLLPLRMASVFVGVQEQQRKIVQNHIDNSKNYLMEFPTLNDEALYNEFKDIMDKKMEKAVQDIVENNDRIDQAIAWSEYAEEFEKQQAAGEKVLHDQGLRKLDEKMKNIEEYVNVVPLTKEENAARKKQRLEEKRAAEQIAVQNAVQKNEEILQINQQNNVLTIDLD